MIEKLQLMTLMFLSGLSEKKNERGATATEYSLLVAFIAFAVLAGATIFGNALSTWFSDLGTTVSGWAN